MLELSIIRKAEAKQHTVPHYVATLLQLLRKPVKDRR